MKKKYFGSDNFAGVHPHILAKLEEINDGYEIAYGQDAYTKDAINYFQQIFSKPVDVFFTFGGTGANVIALQSMVFSFEAVICTESAHIFTDECGAFEKFSGAKIFITTSEDGKIKIPQIQHFLQHVGDEHTTQPRVLSITQSTEYGTVYTIEELKEIVDFAHKNKLYVHVDGARIANACAALKSDLKTLISDTGVDVLTLGGTKNGLLFGEAIVFLNKDLSKNAKFYRKQAMQLFSKMRYVSAQFLELFKNDLFYKNAKHANNMAKIFSEKLQEIPGINLTQKIEANAIFLTLTKEQLEKLQKHFYFYIWKEETKEIRLMTSFQTKESDIEEFLKILSQ